MPEATLNGRTYSVRVMTVREVTEYMNQKPQARAAYTTAELLLDRTFGEDLVRQLTGATTEALNGDVNPDELDRFWGQVEQANHFLLGMSSRLMRAAPLIMEAAAQAERTSCGSPAPSQGMGTAQG